MEAAARTWFGKSAKELSLAEAALLTALLRGPSYYRPDRHPERALELRDRLIDTLAERGVATAEEARRAKLEPLPEARLPIAAQRIQAADMAAKLGNAREHLDRYGRFRSTLDADKQNILLAELRAALANMDEGVTAAAVLVENKTAKVRGYVGNAREGTGAQAAWVDCAASPRSPGSALKPFIYALAFERGIAAPATMIADVPDADGAAGVRNFDRFYRGPVSARTALADSLNVPAVKMFRAAGAESVLGLLRRLGFSRLTHEAAWYGDSLALGGCEVTALELARAYRALAAGGRDAPLLWYEDAPAPDETPLLSEAAAALTLDVLKEARRTRDLVAGAENDGKIIAFKTGTSYGLRDAWCAAVTPDWTLVVWLGDPRGTPRANLAGLTAAAPAAVRVMLRLTQKNAPWFALPAAVEKSRALPALRRAARTMVSAENYRSGYKKRHGHGALPPPCSKRRRDKNNLARRARALLRLARKGRNARAPDDNLSARRRDIHARRKRRPPRPQIRGRRRRGLLVRRRRIHRLGRRRAERDVAHDPRRAPDNRRRRPRLDREGENHSKRPARRRARPPDARSAELTRAPQICGAARKSAIISPWGTFSKLNNGGTEMGIKYVLIIQCDIARQRCSGFACTDSFYNRAGFFKDCGYAHGVRYIALTCGGTRDLVFASKLEHFSKKLIKATGIKKDEVAVHLSSCMVTDNYHHDRCPHLDYIKALVLKKGFKNIVEGTFQSENATKKRAAGIYKDYELQKLECAED